MTETHFKEFLSKLPPEYQDRFKRLGTFHKLAGDDGKMDYSEFKDMLDMYAKMAVEGTDIELEKPPKQKFKLFGDEPTDRPRFVEKKVSQSPRANE